MNGAAQPAALRALASLLLPLGVVLLCASCATHPALRERLATYHAELDRELRYMQSKLLAGQFLLLQIGAAVALLVLSLGLATGWPLSIAPAVIIGPRFWVDRQRRARTARIDEQLDAWLLTLSNGLKANPSLGEAIEASATLAPEPLSRELSLTIKETRLGMPLDRALRQMVERARSPVVSAAVATLNIARSSGGDLSRTLESAAASLREMARLEGVVRTKTAEGRAQAALIGVLPGPLLWLLNSINPDLFDPLWSTFRGHLVLAAAAMLWASALIWARKIVAVEV
jgi:tight adherence protein B